MSKSALSSRGILLVLTAGISWGFLGVFVRMLSDEFSTLDIVAIRSICSGLLILTYAVLFQREQLKIKLKDSWCVAGNGILSITLFNLCFFMTVKLTTINIAVVLLYTSPVFVTLLSLIFFNEKFSFKKVLALVSVVAGCALVSGVGSEAAGLSPVVLALGLGAGFCYALYTIFGRFARLRGYSGLTITLWTFLFAGVCGIFLLDWQRTLDAFANGDTTFFLALAGMVLGSTILPYCAYTAALKHLEPSTAAITASVEPLVATLAGIFIYHENLTFSALAGMILILCAMTLCRESGK